MTMKAKQCSYPNCEYVGTLWKSKPPLCKTHAMMVKSKEGQGKSVMQVTGTNAELKPFYKKVYSTINKVSDKQLDRLKEYRKVRDRFLKENPFCLVCGDTNVQLHHMKGRIGDLLTDTRYFAPLCDKHHKQAENSPTWAKSIGISANRLDK